MEVIYRCGLCPATKTIKQPSDMTPAQFLQEIPPDLPCTYLGCKGVCVNNIKRS